MIKGWLNFVFDFKKLTWLWAKEGLIKLWWCSRFWRDFKKNLDVFLLMSFDPIIFFFFFCNKTFHCSVVAPTFQSLLALKKLLLGCRVMAGGKKLSITTVKTTTTTIKKSYSTTTSQQIMNSAYFMVCYFRVTATTTPTKIRSQTYF